MLAAGCGGGGGGSSDELASLVPADAPVYLESVVRPEGAQRDAIDSLASRVGGIDDPGSAIVQQLDAELSNSGAEVTYDDDIAPWLGERAGIFFPAISSSSRFAAVFETTDAGAAQDFLKKLTAPFSEAVHESSYNGVQYFQVVGESGSLGLGVVDDFLVVGTLDAFKAAVDASDGDSLADSSAFEDGTSALPDDNVALGYVDGEQAGEQLASIQTDPLKATILRSALHTVANGPVTFAVSAGPDTATADVSLPTGVAAQLDPGDLVGRVPANAWFAIGLQNVGSILGKALGAADTLQLSSISDRFKQLTGVDPHDATAWMTDGYEFVSGTSPTSFTAGLVVGTNDQRASADAILALRKKFEQDADATLDPPRVQGADPGFSATAPESPEAIDVAQVGDQVVGALGPGRPGEEALDPQHPLADDPAFQSGEDALGDVSPLVFVSLPQFLVVAEQGGSASDPGYVAAKPYLQKLDYLIAGTSESGDRSTARVVVGAK